MNARGEYVRSRDLRGDLVDRLAFSNAPPDDDLARLRARLVVTIAILSVPFWLLYGGIWYWTGLPRGLWVSLFGASGCLLWIPLLRLGLSPQMSGRGLALTAATTFIALALFVRGFDLPLLSWNLLIPVAAVLFRGPRTAFGWIVALASSWLSLWWFDAQGYLPRANEFLDPNLRRLLDLSNLIGTMLMLVMIVGSHARVQARREQEREDLRKQLSHAEHLANLGTLAASIGHEINNPLAYTIHNLKYLSDLPTRHEHSSIEERKALDDALDGATRVESITARLNAFVRRKTTPRPMRIARCIDAALDLARAGLAPIGRVELNIAPHLHARATEELVQVIVNLLVNAADAIQERTESTESGLIEIDAFAQGDRAVIEVKDNGKGMPDEVQRRIFDPFFTTKEPGRGTGLGLSISREIVNQLDGEITASVRIPHGTVLRITLALEAPAPPSLPQIPNAIPDAVHILVVDDEPALLRGMQRHLRDFHIDVAHNASEALRALRLRNYDMVLCDVMMPGMTGPELYYRTKEELGDPSAERFVFMTGGVFSEDQARALEKTGRDTLAKPIGQQAIAKYLERVTKRALH